MFILTNTPKREAMIIKLKYSYYTKRPIIDGRTQFRKEDFVEGELDFDTEKYRDDEGNYWNVVSDFIQDSGVKERYSLNVNPVKE